MQAGVILRKVRVSFPIDSIAIIRALHVLHPLALTTLESTRSAKLAMLLVLVTFRLQHVPLLLLPWLYPVHFITLQLFICAQQQR